MPSRLSANTRSGILAEKLGVLLLEEVSAVATLIEADDFGVDAICTLLHPRIDKTRAAASTFFVQMKTKAVASIDYTGKSEIDWFVRQELPFFVGKVDRLAQSISLYATQQAYKLLLQTLPIERVRKISLVFDSNNGRKSNGELKLPLGNPILSWTLKQLGDEQFHSNAFACLNSWIAVEKHNAITRPLGYMRLVEFWKTGDVVEATGGASMSPLSNNEGRITGIEFARPGLSVLILNLIVGGAEDEARWAIELIGKLKEFGVDVDADGHFVKQYNLLRKMGEAFRKAQASSTK